MACPGYITSTSACRPKDIPEIEKFYGSVLGLTVGPRPIFRIRTVALHG